MKIRTIRYYIREAFGSIIMNRLMSVASIFTVTSCIFIVSVFFILSTHVSYFVRQLGDTIGIAVFLEEDITQTQTNRLQQLITGIPNVTSVRYISADEALQGMIYRFGKDAPILAGLVIDNPLRSSFEIEIADVAHHAQVERALQNIAADGIGGIRNDANLANILSTLSDVVQVISLLLILVLGVVAIVIITNTINITVNARRTEINIMKYVGATDWFIRWPFIIEGILIGLVGGLIPALITWAVHDRVIGALGGIQELTFISFVERQAIFAQLFPFALLLGTVIGLVGSGVSVRRHLKV